MNENGNRIECNENNITITMFSLTIRIKERINITVWFTTEMERKHCILP